MKFNDFKYEHIDIEDLKKTYEKYLAELKEINDPINFKKKFDEINVFRGHIYSLQQLCQIRHDINTVDQYYDTEMAYWNKITPLLQSYEVSFTSMVMNCPFKDELNIPKTYFLSALYKMKAFSNKIIPLLQEENRLCDEYGKLKASAKIYFNNQTYNLSSIEINLSSEDEDIRKGAFKAINDYYEEHEDEFDEIYDKLVKIRTKMAHELGYKDFVELGYIRMQRYDYDEKMVENYRNEVIKHVVPLTVKLRQKQAQRINADKINAYDLNYRYKTGNPIPENDINILVNNALKMYQDMSKETSEFFTRMVNDDLFDLPSRNNKNLGGYCTAIFDYKAPFIFANSNGTTRDVETLTHEAGHALQAYLSLNNIDIPDLCIPTMEQAEINSMSMEFFAEPYSDLFFGKDGQKYNYDHLSSAIYFLPYGCLVDHFQHEVYHHPEMSKEERKKAWRRLEKIYKPDIEYTGYDLLEKGGYFYRQGHIFMGPFYYIDYALAQVCALQFYVRTLNNDENAWKDYLKTCEVGGTMTFIETLKHANLTSPFEKGCLENIVTVVEEKLNSIDDQKL